MARNRSRRKQHAAIPPQPVETDPEVLEHQYQLAMQELKQSVMSELALMETTSDYADPDEAEWSSGIQVPIGGVEFERNLWTYRRAARTPYGRRIINLYRWYVTKDVCVHLCPKENDQAARSDSDPVVKDFEAAIEAWEGENPWFSHGEAIERRIRDGDMILWRNNGKIRFLDPENLMTENFDQEGAIVTEPLDVVSVQKYIITRKERDPSGSEKRIVVAEAAPEDILMMKNASDSSTKRGTSVFEIINKSLSRTYRTEDNEFMLRLSQSAITKVVSTTGGSKAVSTLSNSTKSTNSSAFDNISSTEKARPGTTVTKGAGVDVKFSHPDNNFSDASPLIAWFLKMIAAATGWSYAQISCDASEGNLASMSIAEGPVAEMICAEREEHEKLVTLYKWIAEAAGVEIAWSKYEIEFEFKPLAAMEPLKNAQVVNLGIMNQTISRATGSTLMGQDAEYERKQIEEENASGVYNAGFNNQNPTQGDKQQSSSDNAQSGSGTNQGNSAPQPMSGSMDSMGKQ